jgi:Zn-dependent peptidase ImmA (M78 family)
MDETDVQRRAREFVRSVDPRVFPVDLDLYAKKADAVLHVDSSLGPDESGWSSVIGGKLHVTVNGNETRERQRFSVCHEIAHYVLELPSEHAGTPLWSYAKRPLNEVLCDVFAAELLLPLHMFKPLVDAGHPGFALVESVSRQAEASLMATASRFAAMATIPCAFVLSEGNKIKYSTRSAALRAMNAWIQPRSSLPAGSVTARVCSGGRCDGPEEVNPDLWFTDWNSGGTLFEEARFATKWHQGLTLLWGDEEEIAERRPQSGAERSSDTEYCELDGVLPWPGRRKRK